MDPQKIIGIPMVIAVIILLIVLNVRYYGKKIKRVNDPTDPYTPEDMKREIWEDEKAKKKENLKFSAKFFGTTATIILAIASIIGIIILGIFFYAIWAAYRSVK